MLRNRSVAYNKRFLFNPQNNLNLSPKRFRAPLLAITVLILVTAFMLVRSLIVTADSTAQALPFSQNWTNTGLITTNDNWSGVPGIIGYRGDGLVSSTGVNPQTVLAESNVVNVIANQTSPNTLATGGVAEFQITDPVVALQGSGTARAPYVQFHLSTIGVGNIIVAYNLRDIDGSADNAVQPVALQFRVGNSGNFTNVPAGFVADATTGPSLATLVTAVSATLPAAANNQPMVQVRVITTDAAGSDEWVGIDDINVAGTSIPTGAGNANPNSVFPTGTTLLTVTVTPASNPTSTAHTVTADLSAIGGSASQQFFDNGTNGDVTPGDNVFSFAATVANGTTGGSKTLPFTVTETAPLSRASTGTISLTVQATTNPSGTGAANPTPVQLGANTLLTVTVTPGTNPTSSGLTVNGDLTSIGGSPSQQFFDNGTNGDNTAGDNVFSFNANIPGNVATGAKSLPIQISDAQARSASTSISLNVQAPPPPAGSLAISQIYGGGGNSGATFRNDFIEIINRTGATISLSGLSIQYASAAGTSWQVTTLSGSLDPGQYYLVQEASGGANGVLNPTPDATGGINLSGTAGKVALVGSTTALSDGCPSDPSIIDFVGYGTTASCYEGSGSTPAPSNANSVFRDNNGCNDTDDNADDFSPDTANPRNTSSPTNNCAVFGGVGSANPTSVQPGDSSTLTVNVTPGSNPTSTDIAVVADLSAIGGSASQSFSGTDNSFTYLATVALGTTPGQKSLPVTITDAQARTANTTINITVLQPPPSADHVVISQIYGGGGNSTATYKNDFVELYNPGSNAFDLTGWSIQYSSFNGSGWGSNKQPLGGTIGSGEYYLLKLASGGTEGADLPPANVEGIINLSGTTGKVALVSSFQPLTGNCPLADPNLVDFVGYGSSASTSGFCYEGTAPAPGPAGNNAVSVLRKGAGATDTNNNSNDLQIGAVNPRRTAPIVELGPNVLTTDPASNGFNIPHDASITVSFTEPVDVVGAWYNIACADLTTHNDATVVVSNTFKTYVITPNVNFAFGQQCTVTIIKDNVHDQDLNDSGPNTDTPPSDYSWTFSVVAAGDPAPYPPSVHLTMGNPSNAVADTSEFNNYLMEKPTYSLSYNRDKGTPNWVSWHLEPAWFGNLTRFDTFRPDPAVPPDWYRVQATDYSGSGFDRGHMTPNADRDNENRIPINQETYLMSNMVPQAPDNNQGPWAAFENYLRSIVTSPQSNELYIVSGPQGVGGSGSTGGTTNTIAFGHVTVPQYTWKVVLVIPIGDNDVSRVTAATRTIAILMPNTQGIRNNPWETYLTTVDHIEELTGYNFFANVPDAVENAIEAGTNGTNPPGTSGQAVTTAEDNSTNITLTAVSPAGALTYTIVTPPAHGQLTGSNENRSYVPDPNYNGADSFTFKVNDGSQDSNTSTVTITVSEVNDPPTTTADNAGSTDEDLPLTISAADLAINDQAGPANESQQTFTVTSVTSTVNTHGTVSLDNGTITYTPASNYNGLASFTYQVCDNGTTNGAADSQCATGTVNITVNPVNDAPVLGGVPATDSVIYGTNLTFTASASDVDLPAQTLTFSLVGAPLGASINPSSGVSSWTPTAAQADANYTFSVQVSDGQTSTSSSITVTVQLKPVTSLGPGQLWLGVNKGGDVGTKFDLLAEVFRNGVQLIGSGQLNGADVGAVNFNTALLKSITVNQNGASGFRTGDTLSIRLSVRIADSSPNKNGTVRLWYNDAAANSNFAATIGGVANNYFLRTGSALTTVPGAGPRSNIDVTVKRTGGNPWVPFGTWGITY